MCRHRGRQDAARARQSAGCVFICSWFGTCEVKSRGARRCAAMCMLHEEGGSDKNSKARRVNEGYTLLYSTLLGAQHSKAQHSTAQHSATKAVCAWCWAVNCGFVGCPLHRLIVSTCGLGGVGCRTVWRADGRNGKGLDCWPKGKRQYLEKKRSTWYSSGRGASWLWVIRW